MRWLLAIALVLAAAPAPAAPAPGPTHAAATTADLDRNGVTDDVRLTWTELEVAMNQGAGPVLRFPVGPVSRGSIVASGRWIALEVESSAGVEGIALAYQAGALRQLWRGAVGPVGVDGDYRVELIATASGIVRHQSRRDVRRCDGKPALLFAEGWDDARRAFRPIRLATEVSPSAPVLPATRVAATVPPRPVGFAPQAASSMPGASDAGALTAPRELDDGDVATTWREDRGGDGRGEFVTYRAVVRGERARALWIAPAPDAGLNRPIRLAVVGADRAYWVVLPEDGPGSAYRVELPEPVADCISVVIGEVRRGKGAAGGGTTALGELHVLGDADLAPGGPDAALVADVMTGGAAAAGAADALVRRGAAGAQALVTALAAPDLAHDVRVRLLRVLIRSKDPAGAPAIAAGMARDLAGPDLGDAARALAAMGASAVPALGALAADTGQSTEARVAALGALADVPAEAATAALLGAAGTGPRAARVAVTRALGRRPLAELLAASAPSAPPAHGDLLRGIGLAALRAKGADRARASAALAAALAATGDYEVSYRAIQGLASIGDDAAVRGLAVTLRGYRAGSVKGSALRQVAALAVARNPAAEGTELLTALSRDADPGVRLRAINSLAQRPALTGTSPVAPGAGSADAIDRVLIEVLARDPWPELRRASAATLGERCARPGPATALDEAVRRDAEVAVRGDALAGLVACRSQGIADRLIEVALDGKAPLELRERAVALTVALEDARLEDPVAQLFARWRGAAFDSHDALALARVAAGALGRIGGPKAAAALEEALADEALPELVAAAAGGLGMMGERCPRRVVPRLRELARSSQRMVAVAASRAAARCGK
jgi:hypothetical protein